jgi:hypothetical protein
MRKFLDFVDDKSWELSPLSYDEFERLGRWSGGSDIAFGQWLRHNKFYELDQLSKYAEPPAKPGIRIEEGEPEIDWNYDKEAEQFWL